jgi:hypothetical protein
MNSYGRCHDEARGYTLPERVYIQQSNDTPQFGDPIVKAPLRIFGTATLLTMFGCAGAESPITNPLVDESAQFSRDSHDDRDDDDRNVLPIGRFTSRHDKCKGRDYDAFDFWVGKWDVYPEGSTTLAGTNVVTKDVDGCVVEEHWTDAAGLRGRSLNAYDASTQTWNQLWMDQTGGALQLGGTGGRGMMQMEGTHQTNRFDPTLQTDRITWTSTGRNRVRQVGELSTAGGPFTTLYDLNYFGVHRATTITPSTFDFCGSPARPRFHAFDFLLGSWQVRGEGRETLRTTVSTDLSGCLVEERMRGPGGYEAVAYSGFRTATFVWNWMFVDSRGVQLQLSGPATLTGTNMILTGRRTDRNGAVVDVRVEWAVVDAATVEQRWSFSTDAGASWSAPTVLKMTH